MNNASYKQKYQELKYKFMESVDAAFRIGYEQGMLQAQQDSLMQQQQAAQESQKTLPGREGYGSKGSPAGEEQMQNPNSGKIESPDSESPEGSELDQHISKLESMLGKSDMSPSELFSAVQNLRKYQSELDQRNQLKKSQESISAISKALHTPNFKLGKQASHNLTENGKTSLSMQHKIVEDIMKSWELEENKAASDIKNAINFDELLKK